MGFWRDTVGDKWLGIDNNQNNYNPAPYIPPPEEIPAADPYTPAPVAPAPAPAAPAPNPFDPSPFRANVDSAFSMFTPEFYANRYAQIYDPYKANVSGQYGLARDTLESGLASRGLGNSQQGRGLFQQLDALRDQSLTGGQSQAQGFQTSLTGQVDAAKNNLYGSIGEGADNTGVGSRAQSEAARIAATATPQASLGDVFGDFIKPYASSRNPGGLPVNPEQQAFVTGGNLNLANSAGGPEASTSVVGNKKKKF